MDGTSRAKQGQPSPKSWTPNGVLSDQVWLEELIGPSYNQLSCPSAPSSSDGTCSLHSWSSGVTGLLNSSIKKQSQDAFQTRLRQFGKLAGCPSRGPRGRAGQGGGNNKLHAWPERGGLCQRRGSAQNHKLQCLLEEKIEAKVKFSQFLDEVTSNVLDQNSLQAFGKPVSPTSNFTTTPSQPEDQIQVATQRSPRLLRSMAQEQKKTREEQTALDPARKTYLETDIDAARRDDEHQEIKAEPQLETDKETVIPPPPEFCEGFEMKSPFPEFDGDFPRYPYRSASLPRGVNMVSDESDPSL